MTPVPSSRRLAAAAALTVVLWLVPVFHLASVAGRVAKLYADARTVPPDAARVVLACHEWVRTHPLPTAVLAATAAVVPAAVVVRLLRRGGRWRRVGAVAIWLTPAAAFALAWLALNGALVML